MSEFENASTHYGGDANAPQIVVPPTSSSRTAILVLTITAAFFSLFIGGCTSATFQGLASSGDALNEFSNDFESRYGPNSSTERVDTESIRSSGGSYALLGLLECVLAIVGGVWAYRTYGTTTRTSLRFLPEPARKYLPSSVRSLTLAGCLVLLAAALSITNAFTFITAGVMNGIAAALCLLNKPDIK